MRLSLGNDPYTQDESILYSFNLIFREVRHAENKQIYFPIYKINWYVNTYQLTL